MSRIKNRFKKITSQSKLMVVAGWVAFLFGALMLSPDLLLIKILLLAIARVLP